MQAFGSIALALLATPAALGAAEPRFGGEAGRARILEDAQDLDKVPDVAWPDRKVTAAERRGLSPAKASLIKKQSKVSTADSAADSWAQMQGLVDGLQQDAEDGKRDAAVVQALSAEQGADEREQKLAAKKELAREERALQKQGMAGVNGHLDLDLASAGTYGRAGKGASLGSMNWHTLRGQVDDMAFHNEGMARRIWNAKVEDEVNSIKSIKAEMDTDAAKAQSQEERYAEAQHAKARYDEIRRRQKIEENVSVHSPLEGESVLLQAKPAGPRDGPAAAAFGGLGAAMRGAIHDAVAVELAKKHHPSQPSSTSPKK